MRLIKGTTTAQTKFLRSFRTDPFGPGVADWPSPAILRRWLRRPGFVAAMHSVRDAIRYQADFQLLASAGAAAHVMHTTVTTGGEESQKPQIAAMSTLLKLLHVRERFQPPEPLKRSNPNLVSMVLGEAHPESTAESVREMLRLHYGIDVRAEYVEQRRREHEASIASGGAGSIGIV